MTTSVAFVFPLTRYDLLREIGSGQPNCTLPPGLRPNMLLLQHTRKLVAEADNRILRQTGYGPVGGPSSLLRKLVAGSRIARLPRPYESRMLLLHSPANSIKSLDAALSGLSASSRSRRFPSPPCLRRLTSHSVKSDWATSSTYTASQTSSGSTRLNPLTFRSLQRRWNAMEDGTRTRIGLRAVLGLHKVQPPIADLSEVSCCNGLPTYRHFHNSKRYSPMHPTGTSCTTDWIPLSDLT